MMRRGMRRGRPGLVGMAARTAVVAGTATAVSGNVSRRQQAKAQQAADAQADNEQQQQQAYAPPPPPPPADAGAGESQMITQLKELAALKEQGILTDAEFEAQKAKILA